ncbi:MAG: rod shape-determining protein MreC [Methyloceanibacter sp.]
MNFTLIFVCVVLLVLGRIGHAALDQARDGFLDLTAPVLEAASVPAIAARHGVKRVTSYVGSFNEIDRLKGENARLRQWEWRAKLAERKVAQLRALLNAADEPALHFATGDVIADGRGPFLQSALVNLGRDDGVRVGYAVINGDGLVGRTVEAGNAFARVLLINDHSSHIPVLAGKSGVRGIASGEGGGELTLDFLPDGAVLHEGDEVFTSGSDGVLPRGLRVGAVTGSPGAYKVRPHADLGALDVVSVLFFDTPELVRTDPPAAPLDRALSEAPADTRVRDAVPTASVGGSEMTGAIKQAGAPAASAGASVAQTQQ